jgi:hypothetical protein
MKGRILIVSDHKPTNIGTMIEYLSGTNFEKITEGMRPSYISLENTKKDRNHFVEFIKFENITEFEHFKHDDHETQVIYLISMGYLLERGNHRIFKEFIYRINDLSEKDLLSATSGILAVYETGQNQNREAISTEISSILDEENLSCLSFIYSGPESVFLLNPDSDGASRQVILNQLLGKPFIPARHPEKRNFNKKSTSLAVSEGTLNDRCYLVIASASLIFLILYMVNSFRNEELSLAESNQSLLVGSVAILLLGTVYFFTVNCGNCVTSVSHSIREITDSSKPILFNIGESIGTFKEVMSVGEYHLFWREANQLVRSISDIISHTDEGSSEILDRVSDCLDTINRQISLLGGATSDSIAKLAKESQDSIRSSISTFTHVLESTSKRALSSLDRTIEPALRQTTDSLSKLLCDIGESAKQGGLTPTIRIGANIRDVNGLRIGIRNQNRIGQNSIQTDLGGIRARVGQFNTALAQWNTNQDELPRISM